MNNEIIVVKQLPVIIEHLEKIKEEVTERVSQANSLVCTEDTVKDVKKARAELNTEFKEWENKRKEVKTAIMSPYEQFEAVYKDCITNTFRKADDDLKNKISSVENELKAQKRKEVEDYFTEYLKDAEFNNFNGEIKFSEYATFDKANINVTLSASLKSLKEKAKEFVDTVVSDLTLIQTQEHKEEIEYEYSHSLNVSAAITTVSNKYKAIEAEKARRAEMEERRKQAEAEAKAPQETTPPVAPPITAPKEETTEQEYSLTFKVIATKAKLKALKTFLDERGYKYE